MTVIDKRATLLTVTFGDLAIGDAFQDHDGDICIKTDIGAAIYWAGDYWSMTRAYDGDELIIPLEITYLVERKKGK